MAAFPITQKILGRPIGKTRKRKGNKNAEQKNNCQAENGPCRWESADDKKEFRRRKGRNKRRRTEKGGKRTESFRITRTAAGGGNTGSWKKKKEVGGGRRDNGLGKTSLRNRVKKI